MNARTLVTLLLVVSLGSVPALAQGPRFRFNQDNTAGWSELMSVQEQTEYRNKMLAARTYDECKTIQADHKEYMQARANEIGATFVRPRFSSCGQMRDQGLLK